MDTTVGTETRLPGLVEGLRLLEHDAIAVYAQTIAHLQGSQCKQQIAALGTARRRSSCRDSPIQV